MTPHYALPQRSPWLGFALWVSLALASYLVWQFIPSVYIEKPRENRHLARNMAFIPYSNSGKFGYADPMGKSRIPPRYDGADGFSEGRARVLMNGRFGFIDTSGAMVIPARFAWASAFRGGYASVWTGTDWNYLDLEGRELTTFPKQDKPPQVQSL
jgi:WG containing repeat